MNTTPTDDQPSEGVVEIALPADPESVAFARRFVADQWADLDDATMDDVKLIVSELVTNAVRHGRPQITLKLRRAPFAVDIAVLDHGPGEPQLTNAGSDATSGRGLAIIDHLAEHWGCQRLNEDDGKVVWASVQPG